MSFLSTPHDEIMYDNHTSSIDILDIDLTKARLNILTALNLKIKFHRIRLGVGSNGSPKFELL